MQEEILAIVKTGILTIKHREPFIKLVTVLVVVWRIRTEQFSKQKVGKKNRALPETTKASLGPQVTKPQTIFTTN